MSQELYATVPGGVGHHATIGRLDSSLIDDRDIRFADEARW